LNLQSLKKFLKWCSKHTLSILSVLFVSVLFPAVLADYNQRAAISKTAYEVDYKAAKNKVLECQREHSNYLHSLTENASTAEFLYKHYSIENIKKHAYSQAYFIALRSLMETYSKSLKKNDELLASTSYCYKELDNLYQNLALSLDLLVKYEKVIQKSNLPMSKAIEERNHATDAFKQKAGDNALDYMFEVLISEDEEKLYEAMQIFNFHNLAMLQMNNIELEKKLFSEKENQINVLNKMFSNQLNKRFHHGIRSYIRSFFII